MRSEADDTGGPDGMTYVGHATVLVELAGIRVLTDPLLRAGILHVRRRVPAPAPAALEPLDAILISHAHHDHLDPGSLRRLAGACPVMVPRGCAGAVRDAGAPDVRELDVGDRVAIGGVAIEALHAEHDGRRYPWGPQLPALGYLLDGPTRVYFAGDTDLFDSMSALAGRVDVAALPIWGWGAHVGAGHLDPDRAAEAVTRIAPRVAVPIHWGTLRALGAQRGLHPHAPAEAFAERVAEVAPATSVRILAPGERMAFGAG